MDPVLAGLDEVARGLAHAVPRVPWAGALDGRLVAGPDPAYWAAQARQPVRFADAVATLAERGVSVFIEVGPDGTLSALGPAVLDPATRVRAGGGGGGGGGAASGIAGPVFIPVLRPKLPAGEAVLGALAGVHVAGARVDWAGVLPQGRRVELPTYAFQRRRYWPRSAAGGAAAAGRDGAGTVAEARFWAAVEGGSMEELAAELGLAGELGAEARRPFGEVLPVLASWRRRARAESAAAGWLYRVAWVPVPDPGPAALAGTWLLVVPAGEAARGLAAGYAAALAAAGTRVVTVQAGPEGAGRRELAALVREALEAAQPGEAVPGAAVPSGVVPGAGVPAGAVPGEVVPAEMKPAEAVPAAAGPAEVAEVAPADGGVAGVVSLLALDEAPLAGFPVVPAGLAGTAAAGAGPGRCGDSRAVVGGDVRGGGGRAGGGAVQPGAGAGVGAGPGRGPGAPGPVGRA